MYSSHSCESLCQKTVGEQAKKDADIWKIKKEFQTKFFVVLKTFHCLLLEITRDATRCNNRDDLLHFSFTFKISIFSETYVTQSRTFMMELLCRLLTTKFRSVRGASRQPAFMSSYLTICQTCLPCPPIGKIRLRSWTMVVGTNKL